jgi:hypothetical protein
VKYITKECLILEVKDDLEMLNILISNCITGNKKIDFTSPKILLA